MVGMLKQKLSVLSHPDPDNVDINDKAEFQSVVLWLEDQKIRHYPIDGRDELRNFSIPEWDKAFLKYQTDLGSPVIDTTPLEQLTWLLSLAIRLVYSDGAKEYNKAIAERVGKKSEVPNIVSTNPLDNLDFSSPAFKNGVSKLATIARVGPHPDPRVQLSALATVIKGAPHPPPTGPNRETAKNLDEILSLIFISELRSLQTSINETLVAVQNVTANPKTDSSLGKVGF